jgi:CelD/BcsL family acetyltransferase involved in cellulose biosynthesis
MYGTACAEAFGSLAALPPDARVLIDQAPGLFAGTRWWQVVVSDAMPAGAAPVFVVVRDAGPVAAVLPMRLDRGGLSSLTTPYTCEYTPLVAPGLDETARVGAMTALAGFCRRFGVVRLDALPAEWEGIGALTEGARAAGLQALRFDHFGNWSEDVAGVSWSSYLLARPGALRETIRRRLRGAERLGNARFELLADARQMDRAAAAFEAVYQRSWKEPEPFSRFNVAFMRSMAEAGLLRFGLWSLGTQPVAVQLWVVHGGCATVLKLAHDEAFKAHSPGTVLTALMLRHLLDEERVAKIDFGRGDDAYKQGWAATRRQRVGVLLVNPWRPAGAAELIRHVAGRVRAAAGEWSARCPRPILSHADPSSSRGDQKGPAEAQCCRWKLPARLRL